MQPLKMRYLLLSSLIFLFSCTNEYRSLQSFAGDPYCIKKFRPNFTSELYKANVEVTGRKLSGLLLIKTMQDSSIRMVFSTETGFKFFDFGFESGQTFKVYQVVEQLNKKAVLQALRADFELLLMRFGDMYQPSIYRKGNNIYYGFSNGNKTNYYLTDTTCSELQRAEMAGKRKKLVSVQFFSLKETIPDSIYLQHYNFTFNISLKKLER